MITPADSLGVILCAAGKSTRMGADKLLLQLPNGRTVFEQSCRAFDECPFVTHIVAAVSPERLEAMQSLIASYRLRSTVTVCAGGAERCDTVLAALDCVRTKYVAIHDAARPFVTMSLIQRTYEAAVKHGAAVPVVSVKDTIHVSENGFAVRSLQRSALAAAQTPQIFLTADYQRILCQVRAQKLSVTDDCSACIQCGLNPLLVAGEETNIKFTTPADLKYTIKEKDMRIGHGYDVHRLVPDRALMLGGVCIPYEKGLLGHSDADVLLHAVCDSLLGAAALGDIGKHFPDFDPAYKGISSILLLQKTADVLSKAGYKPVNLDVTVCAQRPKLAAYIPEMRQRIAETLAMDIYAVSVKATTEEGLGFTGSGEGISATAVCLIERI